MQIDAETAIWLNVIYGVLTGVTGPMLSAAGIPHSEQVMAWMALAAFPLNLILHAYSSSTPGPLAPPDTPAVKAATAADAAKAAIKSLALIALLGLGLLAHGEARAANLGPAGRFASASSAPAPASSAAVPSLSDITNGIKTDADKANIIGQLKTIMWRASQPTSATNPTPFDPYAVQCMPALIAFIQTIPTPGSEPTPPAGSVTGSLTDLYDIRATAIQTDNFINATGATLGPALQPVELGCAALWQNIKNLPIKLGTDLHANALTFINAIVGHAL